MATHEIKDGGQSARVEQEPHVEEVLSRPEIPVEHMPPLATVPKRRQIPEAERLTRSGDDPVLTHRLNRDVAWIMSGLLVVLLAMVGYGLFAPAATPAETHMGLSNGAWATYRSGERASILTPTATLPASFRGWTAYGR